jgi:hypothetical protein
LPSNVGFSRDALGAALAYLLPSFLQTQLRKRHDKLKIGCKQYYTLSSPDEVFRNQYVVV